MSRLLVVGLLAAGLVSGCASNPSGSIATPSQEVIGLNAYQAAVATATSYLKLPLCPTQAPVCRTQVMSQKVYAALKDARAGRKVVSAALNSSTPVPLTTLQSLEAAYAVIQQIQQ